MTAYEELKAWCEKHLSPNDYRIVPESKHYFASIYLAENVTDENDRGIVIFNSEGTVTGIGAVDYDDMCEHIDEYERESE